VAPSPAAKTDSFSAATLAAEKTDAFPAVADLKAEKTKVFSAEADLAAQKSTFFFHPCYIKWLLVL
jgi:hypothetical protein